MARPKVVDLEAARVRQLAEQMLPAMREAGELRAAVSHVEDVERWRKAARIAAHRCGWRVRTFLAGNGTVLIAYAVDRPVSDAEQRWAARLMDEAMFGPSDER